MWEGWRFRRTDHRKAMSQVAKLMSAKSMSPQKEHAAEHAVDNGMVLARRLQINRRLAGVEQASVAKASKEGE